MGSQFVDLNGDGHLDYLTATFDGSPHVSYGAKDGFGPPETLKDASGQRIIITSFWNWEAEEHQTDGRAMADAGDLDERCISALAFDWDADGDYDLLLGSYENGHLYRQMNEGTNAAPKFTGRNIPVMAGDVPFALPAKMTAPILVDWDGDGDMDLIAGSFGDAYTHEEEGGGVYLSLNVGKKGAPSFGPLTVLIPPSTKGATTLTRPDAGLYADAVDYDGDGDLDLVVGGYSMWTPEPRELPAAEQAVLDRLRKQKAELDARWAEITSKLDAEIVVAMTGVDQESKEADTLRNEVYAKYKDGMQTTGRERAAVAKKIEALGDGPMRQSFVWLYERL